MDGLFRAAQFAPVAPGPLAPMAERAAAALKAAGQNVAVFEATTAGLIQAALQAVPGASTYTTCGAITYSSRQAVPVLGVDLSGPRPANGPAYKASKNEWTTKLARRMRKEVGATWCISESGACGPTFNYPDVATGFTSIFVSGPVEKGITVESPHNNREDNMWSFAKLALELLAECVEEAATAGRSSNGAGVAETMVAKEDRYGGVEVFVPETVAPGPVNQFATELRGALQSWQSSGKRGIWLKVPLCCASLAGPAAAQGFRFHHAQPDYVLLTRWLSESPSPLPKYGFTQIGVGGIVVNGRNQVLMVKERVSPLPKFQGSWKLPGGLADPGEHFVETMMREVREETGITGSLIGLVSVRHSHGYRFGQGDIYVTVKMLADKDDINIDMHELADAQWMSKEQIQSLVENDPAQPLDGKVSANNWKTLSAALDGSLIVGTPLPNSFGGKASMLYTAP